MELLVSIGIIAVIWIWISHTIKKKRLAQRRAHLMSKYRDAAIAERIMAGSIWQGQTENQLSDSIGNPVDVDQRVMKNKTRETWKYQQQGKNRFGLRITLEDGVVVGWDQKG